MGRGSFILDSQRADENHSEWKKPLAACQPKVTFHCSDVGPDLLGPWGRGRRSGPRSPWGWERPRFYRIPSGTKLDLG